MLHRIRLEEVSMAEIIIFPPIGILRIWFLGCLVGADSETRTWCAGKM